MLAPPEPHALDQASLGALIGRLVDDGKTYARAEIGVQVATVKARVNGSKLAVALFGAAALLAIAAVIVLVGSLGALLAWSFGLVGAGLAAGGGAVAALIALAAAAICVKVAIGSLATAARNAQS